MWYNSLHLPGEYSFNNTQAARHYTWCSTALDRDPHNQSLTPPPLQGSISLYHLQDACSNSLRLLRQHHTNSQLLPARASKVWEHHYLEVALQITYGPDLEMYHRSFTVAGSNSWNSLFQLLFYWPEQQWDPEFPVAFHSAPIPFWFSCCQLCTIVLQMANVSWRKSI